MSAMTCPKCSGEIEYDVERADSGDGPWAQSYWVGLVRWEEVTLVACPAPEENARTSCGCTWTYVQIEQLDVRATALAGEGPGEP